MQLASVLDEYVYTCDVVLTSMCILGLVLDEYVHKCVGCGGVCAEFGWFWMSMCILASVLKEYVHTCVGCA